MTSLRLGLAGALAGVLVSAAAVAPASAQIGKGEEPIRITSKASECLQKEGVCVWTGDVVAIQADAKMTADKLTLVCDRPPQAAQGQQSCDEIKELIAESRVIYATPDGKISGDKAVYNYGADTITVTGTDVISSRGDEGVVRGTEMVYNVSEGRVRITAGNNRVTSLIIPKKKDPAAQPAPGQPAPAQPAPAQPATPAPAAPAPRN